MTTANIRPSQPHIKRQRNRPLRAFATPTNALISLVILVLIGLAGRSLIDWAILDAAFLPATPETCRAADGACWSFIIAKYGQILFGIYPPDLRWRPALVCLLIPALLAWSCMPRNWTPRLPWVWLITLLSVFGLMAGGILGLVPVPTIAWGGLPVTLILTVMSLGLGFPLAILLALSRSSRIPALRISAVMFIETIRGVPLLSLLFVASIMMPLFVPDALVPDKLVRALAALTMFTAAYLAEVIRGGLQAIPRGQYEAANALSLGYWTTQRDVILPQAIGLVIPALANTVIIMIKNTSLVLVVGIFDLISSAKSALADPAWPSPSTETYLFVALCFFIISFAFARFADFLEHRVQSRVR